MPRMTRYRVFSYPYLSSFTDDYKNTNFELKVIPGKSDGKIAISAYYSFTNGDQIASLIERGLVKVVLRVSCTKLSYIRVYDFVSTNNSVDFSINPMDVTDSVDFVAYLIATNDFEYSCDRASKEWQGIVTKIQKNNVIGESNEETVVIKHEASKGRQSIFNFVEDRDETKKENAPIKTNFTGDHIVFALTSAQLDLYRGLQKKMPQMIVSSILLPVMTEIIASMRGVPSEDADGEATVEKSDFSQKYEAKNWYQIIRAKYVEMIGKDPENNFSDDPYMAAQILLKSPVYNTLALTNEKLNRREEQADDQI